MGFLFPSEKRSLSYHDVWGSGGDMSAFTGSAEAALALTAVYASTSLIADSLASSPWSVFKDVDGVPTRVEGVGLATDPGINSIDIYSWKYQGIVSALLWGNAYGLILAVDSRGIPSKVLWFSPTQVHIDEATGEFFFNGRQVDRSSVIHVPGYLLPGKRKGLSPIALFKSQFETTMQAQRFGSKFFARGTVPSGWMKNTDKALTAAEAQTIKERFIASVSSSEPLVTGSDWEYSALAVPAAEAQFLSAIKATANQVAAIYRVDPEDAGGESGGSTVKYATLEMNLLKFATRTLRPWAIRFESVLNRYLPEGEYIRFNLDAGVRADLKSRYQAHSIAISAGFKAQDEVRLLEELPPLTSAQEEQIMLLRGGATTGVTDERS